MENNDRISQLESRVETLEKWKAALERNPPHKRDKREDIIEALLKFKRFESKAHWIRTAHVSRETFYRHEDGAITELQRRGFRVVYEEVLKGKKRQTRVKLERL